MANNTTKPEPAAEITMEANCLTLREKLLKMREACPEITQRKHSDGVSYKYAKIYDVWEKITPIMNELGVDFDVIDECATKHSDNGDPLYWITLQTRTRNGDKLMFLYEADLTIRWTNLDYDDDFIETKIHAIGWNDDPAKAKGAAHTYALKCYLFEKFSITQGEDDPDNSDFSAQGKGSSNPAGGARQPQQGQQNKGQPNPQGQGQQRQESPQSRLSEAQLNRLYKKAEAVGMSKEQTNARIFDLYKRHDPATLTRQEYDSICASLDAARFNNSKEGNPNV